MKRYFSTSKRTIIAGFVLLGIFGVFKLASAAVVNVGLTPEVGNALGLGTQDVRVTVAIIIRDFMGLLGIIAVVLVLYGGFLWMTAGGEEEKIDKAKKTIVAAVIGLAIVLSAVAIAQFALNALGSATGLENGGGFGGAGGGGGGGLAIGTLYVEDISPSGDVPLRNVVVRIIFSRPLDANTVTGKVAVTGPNGAVAGKLTASGDMVEFEPDAACPAPNGTLKCFDANTSYNVTVSTGIKSSNDQPLVCGGLAPPCSATFKSGNLIDISAPNPVSVQAPDDGQSLPEGAPVPVQINAVDDTGISFEEAFVDGASVGKASPGAVTKDFTGTVNWTEGVTLGDHSLSAKADDLDKHSGSSEAVGVVVRPTYCFNTVLDADETSLNCGGSCGGCADNACVKNSDCASGLCENGICVNRPRIDAVTPLNGSKRPYGAPGTLVTISGAFFGNGPGKVTFNGAAPSDQKEAVTCSAAAWSDSEITVVVPDGAKSGPISVTAANAQTDATNDSRGAMINDFEAGNQTHPGICELTPGSGESGTQVTLAGQGFGDAQGSGAVMFRLGGQDTSASSIETADWSASSVKTNVPSINVSSAATVAVRLVQNGVASNNKGFYLSPLGAGKAPRIDAIDPANGPVREYVTLHGQNFGAKSGTVIFALPDQTTAVGNTDFPAACAVEFWKDDEITVKVPEFYKDGKTPLQEVTHSIKVRRADTVESNSVSFAVKAGVAGPGICALVPDNGAPVATKVDVYGERFGSVAGVLVFTDKLAASPVVKWSDGQITKAMVPAAAATGPVRVVTADKQQSNSVNFFVGACSGNDQCKLGQSCCADGTCRVSCTAVATAGGHAWRFSTGEIPKLPQVVEEKSCSNVTQSPSPYKSITDACLNADLSVRFTAKMEKSSLVPNFFVYKCGATAEFDPSTCKMDAPLAPAFAPTVTDWAKDQSMLTFALKDQDRSPETWYLARVVSRESSTSTIGARSVDGLYLDGDYDGVEGGNYEWRYRTRAGSANCEVDHLEVSPSDYLSSLKNEQLGYRADPTAANCNLLSCIGFSWQWQSLLTGPGNLSADSYAPLTPVTGEPECVRVATTLKETPPGAPVREIATILPQGKTDFGVLAISFLKPEVANYWPSCTGACVNAGVGAEFTIGMDPKTLVPNAAKICECTEESCSVLKNCSDQNPGVTLELGPIKTVEGVEHVMGFRFQNLQHFKKQTWYRVLIQGGNKGVKSESGSALVGLNYGQTYSWKFRTRNDDALCKVDRVSLAPANATLYVMGDTAEYQAIPWSKGDDKCGPTPLAATDYSWNWSAKNLSSAATPAEGVDVSTLPQFAIATFDFGGKKDTAPLNPLKDSVGCQAMCLNAGSQPGLAVCGDGIVSPSEDCDGGAGCDPKTCLWTGKATACANPGPNSADVGCCGNLKIEPGEQCDDANLNSGDGCSAHCMAEGSGFGGSICGNGKLDKGENCDDSSQASGDGCSVSCVLEGSVAGKAVCGNGKIESGEACDDGNAQSGDGCSLICLHEGSGTAPACGNGKVEAGEACDDGNQTSGDSCSSKCLLEGTVTGKAVCGDGKIGLGEACDPGIPEDKAAGCDPNTCLWLGKSPSCNNPNGLKCCGNGKIEPGENCDSGNLNGDSFCAANCLVKGTLPLSVCGNGKIESDEDCDDGNTQNGDGCSSKCLVEGSGTGGSTCGNGDLGKGETCDDGNNQSGDGCSGMCLKEGALVQAPYPVCGNGKPEAGEDCDDGNAKDSDGCSSHCLAEGTYVCQKIGQSGCCGNKKIEAGELCDDGNGQDGDGCGSNCLLEGSSSRYNLFLGQPSYCGYQKDAVPPSKYGTGEICEFPHAGDARPDPSQFARAAFGGEAEIGAAVTNPSTQTVAEAKAGFSFICDCTDDLSCKSIVPGSKISSAGVGCGLGHCCYTRPVVLANYLTPASGESDVCRNALISARFDQVMDRVSLASSTFLLVKNDSGKPCAAGTEVKIDTTYTALIKDYCLTASSTLKNYSVSTVEITDEKENDPQKVVKTEMRINLTEPLNPKAEYAVLILGDHNLDDAVPAGAQSGFKVGLAGDYYWKFRTGAEICQIDHVTVGPEWWLFQTAQNDPADDSAGPFFDSLNDNDKQFTADAWTKHNQTNERIAPIKGYDWAWSWKDSDDKEASIKKPKAGDFETQVIQTVGAPKNDEVSILARATVTENVFGASCTANTDCVVGELCKSTPQGQKCAGKNFEAHAKAVVLICENPWPSRELNGIWKPFVDADTNFSDYYCRDAGKPADTSDDLPVPVSKTPVVITHQKEKVCSNDPGKSCFSSADCGANALCQDRLVRDLLFTLNCPDGSCNPGDAFGYRVMPNLGHLDIAKWYALQGFSGTPAPTTVDGYAALADDRSTYVSAVNQSSVPKLNTNIYLLSSNEGASANTRRIAQSLLLNWSFNANLSSSGLCHSNVCSNDGAKACLSAADCGNGGSCGPVSCRSDFDCGGAAGGVCDAFKEKMQRDVARFSDFRELERGLESYRASRLHCSLSTTRACLVDENCPGKEHCVGDYPVLASGSFIRGLSVSPWESWQNTLGGDLKMTPVPSDPLNRLICDKAAGYDENTCYRSSDQTFACAPGSRAYQYRREGKAYRLASDFEYRVCSNDASRSCVSNSNCALFQNGALVNGVCLTPPWEGQGPIAPVEFDEAAGVAAPIPNVWDLSNACTGQVFGGAAGVCGDGSVGPTEECEVGQKKATPCNAGGYDGYQTEACGTSGTNACKWVPVGGCNAGKCGDGIVQTGEQCDDGTLNGTYGHCETSCMKPATAGHCGDGITQGSESCDFGGYCKKNPSQPCKKDNDCWGALYILDYCVGADIYGGISPDASCTFDCKGPGPYCGDKIVQGDYGEQCDGNAEIDTAFCPKCPDGNSPSTNPLYKNCTVDTANRSQIRTRGCSWLVNKSTACQWAGWSDCSPVGVCGDGVVNPGEECDDGNDNNNDGCIIVKKYVNGKFIVDAPNSCKKSKCGDGYVQSGVEVCDAGGNNVNMSDKQAVAAEADKCPYGKVCQICSTTCASASVSGGYCGDLKVTPNYEICEPGLGKRTGPEADAINANYPGVDQICYPNCQGYCPADFTKSPPFKFVSSLQSPNYVTQVDNLKNKEQWYIAMPACRYLDGISMDLNFIQAEPPKTAILMVANLGQEMIDSYTKAGGISKMMAAKIFMRSVVGTAGQLYENFPGKLKMGLLTGGHLEDAFPKPYDPANHVSGNQKFVQNTCSKFVAGWAKDNNGKIEVAGDGTGYCYVTAPIEQSKIGWQCTYSCVAERSAMAHPPGPQETSNWYVSGSGGGEMVKLQGLVDTLPDWPSPFQSGNFMTALDQAVAELSATDADRKILLVVDGDETTMYCPYSNNDYNGKLYLAKAYKAGIKVYLLDLKNSKPCPVTQLVCGSEQCPQITFAYDQSEKLKEQLFNAVTSIKLSFNGQPAAPYPLNATLTLPTNGLTCLDHEQRLPFSIDWGGEGAVQVKNLIPSYCPLTPGNQPSSVGSFSTGNGFNVSDSNNLGGVGPHLQPNNMFDLYGNYGKYTQINKIPPP